MHDEELTPDQAADILGVKASTLAKWRMVSGKGPRFRKFGKSVRYPLSEIEAFRARTLVSSTKDLRK